jgi:hypothetical protein
MFGAETIAHGPPSTCSIRECPFALPTAHASRGEMETTPDRNAVFPEGGLDRRSHTSPFHRSMSVCERVVPTAHAESGLRADTSAKVLWGRGTGPSKVTSQLAGVEPVDVAASSACREVPANAGPVRAIRLAATVRITGAMPVRPNGLRLIARSPFAIEISAPRNLHHAPE